ncbi:hypothetical protein SCH01S_28_00880 [Sphingomonas changbaiensis NBRC 104936]|uniref:Uncharacterized protein n=1 Tax=Sphingomonas changbaiensis NBRC 104936 TaxID=1219043 RepID=A0A0E9MNV0_9SPHN|nr:hypothetical protein [Sphingomonas changbaiensis]GAO39229.1 hypothetical protein SCH01S_28_00880 [Sphingomonas changbaiensis NBRC 104936]
MEAQQATGAGLLKTLAACLLAPIALIVVAMLWGGVNAILMNIFTVIRPGIIGFFSVLIGTVAGMFAARIACDKWLSGYHPQVVFVVLALLGFGGLLFELFFVPFDGAKINSYVQLGLIALFSYHLFWRYEPIDG